MTWGYKCDRINKLQKKAIRIVSLSKYNAHTEPIFKRLQLLKVADILKIQELKLYYRFMHNTLPRYLQRIAFHQNSTIHDHNTRRQNKLHITRTNHEYVKRCIRHNIPRTINNTTALIINKIDTHCQTGFVTYAKMHYVGNSVVTDVQFGHLFLVCVKYDALQEVTYGLFRKISHCS